MTNLLLHSAAVAIASDFDGTISLQDSNDLLFQLLNTHKNREIERQYRADIIGTRQGIHEHFEALAITQKELAAYCDSVGMPYIHYRNFRDVGNVLFAPAAKKGEMV